MVAGPPLAARTSDFGSTRGRRIQIWHSFGFTGPGKYCFRLSGNVGLFWSTLYLIKLSHVGGWFGW